MTNIRTTPLDPTLADDALMRFRLGGEAIRRRFVLYLTRGDGGCWVWGGSIDADGYGRFWFNYRVYRAHRLAYELVHGKIRRPLEPDHLCRNRACVNPVHIEPVTHRVNALRGATVVAANAIKTHCPQGHNYDATNTYRGRNGNRQCRTCVRENNRRHRAKNRKPPKVGSARADAKLNDEQVRDIKRRLACGESKPGIAELVGVSPKVVYDIDRKITWKHITI